MKGCSKYFLYPQLLVAVINDGSEGISDLKGTLNRIIITSSKRACL